jgi:hypothetical protein
MKPKKPNFTVNIRDVVRYLHQKNIEFEFVDDGIMIQNSNFEWKHLSAVHRYDIFTRIDDAMYE